MPNSKEVFNLFSHKKKKESKQQQQKSKQKPGLELFCNKCEFRPKINALQFQSHHKLPVNLS